MIGNALILTIAILLALFFWLMGELKFLIPYKAILDPRIRDSNLSLPCGPVCESLRRSIRNQSQILPQGHGPEALSSRQTVASRPGGAARTSIDTIDGNDEEVALRCRAGAHTRKMVYPQRLATRSKCLARRA